MRPFLFTWCHVTRNESATPPSPTPNHHLSPKTKQKVRNECQGVHFTWKQSNEKSEKVTEGISNLAFKQQNFFFLNQLKREDENLNFTAVIIKKHETFLLKLL